MLDRLSEEERKVLSRILLEASKQKSSASVSKQIKEIVPIEKWLEREYFVGPDGLYLYDYWKDELKDIYQTNRGKYNEVIVTGSLGTGKSTFALFALIRKLYELSCYENVSSLFNLMSTSMIVFIYFSLTKYQAELTGFGQFRELIDSIPYFKKEFNRNRDLNSILKFPENLMFIHGSDAGHTIGMNLIGSILDEANFFQGETSTSKKPINQTYSKIAKLYSSIVNRGKSRFMGGGVDHSVSFLVSSATHNSSFTEKRIASSMDDPHVKVINSRLWDVKPKGTYSSKPFYVFIGSELLDPYLVLEVNDVNQFLESVGEPTYHETFVDLPLAVEKLPSAYRHLFVAVPIDFKKSFDIDIITSLQDIAGVSVAPTGKLFSARPVYNRACQTGIEHPFYKDRFIISTGSDNTVQDFLRKRFQFKNPTRPRYLHIDQSTSNDSTGVAMVHVEGLHRVEGIAKPRIGVDFMLKIDPPRPPKQLSITRIRDFVFFLRDQMGLNIAKVSYDWFGSTESRQVLEEQGIDADHQSVDRTDAQYLTLVNLLFEERISMYHYEPFSEELFDLIHDRARRKVDHPVGGSKDVSDALVGAIHNALGADEPTTSSAEDSRLFSELNHGSDEEEDLISIEDLLYDYI